MEKTSMLTFITGGVRSGKSSIAEKLAIKAASEIDGQLHYVATSKLTDKEMADRIKRHQKDRKCSSYPWNTWEKESNLEVLSTSFTKNDIVLLDCMTTWLSNELFSEHEMWKKRESEVVHHMIKAVHHISESCHHLIIVSNEVFFEPVYENELVFTYCRLLGKLHQEIVRIANQAYLVEFGLPITMKGGK
ncbi:bifunctional adenosylcobinamide kinase/adenosylcobinamide-phosphate guanylyltransferase [Oceanobacillus senegalensis]|uniref:bifunctional adenosylcobinamide kinase/adenosylcobinamide-phosphate guanylyltransferase n=1 Tax=Oceanobacillus senegalensis TaxID=1936063 RepID=UPI000A304DE8|nr:bifunctional adenosylcobinamide kinase/adenosylcobinamide-phosphate guanylyltransferase [Oceanobacillus senegalensis]